jgi:outer membrane receptor protein involved in Fe transport
LRFADNLRLLKRVLPLVFIVLQLVSVANAANAQSDNNAASGSPDTVATVNGAVVDENRKPIVGADVRIFGPGATLVLETMTDVNGTFTLRDVNPGLYSLSITKDGYSALRRDLALTANTISSVAATLLAPLPGKTSKISVIGRTSGTTTGSPINRSTASISAISQSTITEQNVLGVSALLDQLPGVSTMNSVVYGGNYDNANNTVGPGSSAQVLIRGAQPFETQSLIDGFQVYSSPTIGMEASFNIGYINALMLQGIDIIKGPGALAPNINNALGGSVNYRFLDFTTANHQSFQITDDGYGGADLFGALTGSLGKRLHYVLAYDSYNTPGPVNNVPTSEWASEHTSETNLVNGVNDGPTCFANSAGVYSSPGCPSINGPTNYYDPNYQFTARTIYCCLNNNSTYDSHDELVRLKYDITPKISIDGSYIGVQSWRNAGDKGPYDMAITFQPPAGYTGSIPPGPIVTGGWQAEDTLEQTNEPAFEANLRATIGSASLRFGYFSIYQYLNDYIDGNGVLNYNNFQVYGYVPTSDPTVYGVSNGATYAVATPSGDQTRAVGYTTRDLLNEFTIPWKSHTFSFNLSEVYTHPYGFEVQNSVGPVFATNALSYPYGEDTWTRFDTALLRDVYSATPTLTLTGSVYYNLYTDHVSQNNFASYQSVVSAYTNARAAVAWDPAPNVAWRFGLGGSIVPPTAETLNSANGVATLAADGSQYTISETANGLKPETSFGYDLGADYRFAGGNDLLSSDIYLTTVQNLILSSTLQNGTYNGLPLYIATTSNLAQAREEGFELSVKRDAVGFDYIISGALQRAYAYDLPPGFYSTTSGPDTTNQSVIAGANFNIGGHGTNGLGGQVPYATGYGELSYRFKDNSLVRLGAQYYGPNNPFILPAFTVLSASALYQWRNGLSLIGSVYNLNNVYNSPYPGGWGNGVPALNITGANTLTQSSSVGPRTFSISLRGQF